MVISQEVALFEGSLKENIDPKNEVENIELIRILDRLKFSHQVYKNKG